MFRPIHVTSEDDRLSIITLFNGKIINEKEFNQLPDENQKLYPTQSKVDFIIASSKNKLKANTFYLLVIISEKGIEIIEKSTQKEITTYLKSF